MSSRHPRIGDLLWVQPGNVSSLEEPHVGAVSKKLPNGEGEYTDPNGLKYVGLFKDGRFSGRGTSTLADGLKYEGSLNDAEQADPQIEPLPSAMITPVVVGRPIGPMVHSRCRCTSAYGS